MKQINLLFVCHGNICRSPSAEAVMKHYVDEAGLQDKIFCDSAGIIDYHQGEPADARMREHAAMRNYNLTSISRPVVKDDFSKFDYIIAMDTQNINHLRIRLPERELMSKISKMTDYCTINNPGYVPDPYYGGASGFEQVLDLLENACANFLEQLKNKHQLIM